MPEELEKTGSGQRTGASMLATAALLGARRRWALPRSDSVTTEPEVAEMTDRAASLRSRFVMPAVHLEDPEWSRAVLGLLARCETTRVPASALTLRAGRVEVDFADSVRPAAPPFASVSRTRWSLERKSGTLADLPSTPMIVSASRQSALVTAWTKDDSRCLLDIVQCGSVALDGPPVAVGATLSDVVVELATRRWCDLDELIVVGFGAEIAGLEQVLCLPDIEEATRHLMNCAVTDGTPERGRCLVVAPPVGRRSAQQPNPLRSLVELVHVMPSTGLICCDSSLSSVRASWRLAAHRETLDIALGKRNRPVVRLVPTGALDEHRLMSSEPPTEAWVVDPPTANAQLPTGSEPNSTRPQTAAASITSSSLPAPAVMVRVLGPVDVVGDCASLDRRPRVTELVVYMALHRDGCSGEAIVSAVWADRRVPAQTVANRLSEARQALGETKLGHPRLRRVSGRHVLSPEVSTDWAEFERLTSTGSNAKDWAQALGLVRGRPFEGLAESGWATLDGYLPSMEARIVDVACRLASHSLETRDTSEAEWAIRRGLLAVPWDERLYRLLMKVHHASGNRGGIDAALRSLARVFDWKGDPLEVVHRETADLYRQLVADRHRPA